MKTALVTGAAGFIGRNLTEALGRRPDVGVVALDRDDGERALAEALGAADVVYHLAGVNRPNDDEEFTRVNAGLTEYIVTTLERARRRPAVILSSSRQAALDNAYGRSKRRAEDILRAWARRSGGSAVVYRLPGVFGKWCKPNYNSVVATFCHNVARDLAVTVSDPERELALVHVADVVDAFLQELGGRDNGAHDGEVTPVHVTTVGQLLAAVQAFRDIRESGQLPDLADPFIRKLYSTYVSYLPTDGFAYSLQQKSDQRGVLAEFLKSSSCGQLFVSRTNPGVTRGNHYHDTKTEKFLVIEGEAIVVLRHRLTGETARVPAAGNDFTVVDIPPGWIHAITNVGSGDLVVLFWACEPFDPGRPDTYPASTST